MMPGTQDDDDMEWDSLSSHSYRTSWNRLMCLGKLLLWGWSLVVPLKNLLMHSPKISRPWRLMWLSFTQGSWTCSIVLPNGIRRILMQTLNLHEILWRPSRGFALHLTFQSVYLQVPYRLHRIKPLPSSVGSCSLAEQLANAFCPSFRQKLW